MNTQERQIAHMKEKFKDFDYRDYVWRQSMEKFMLLNDEEIQHVANGLRSMVMQLTGVYSGGDFINALIDNNLMQSVGRADQTNQKAIPIYCSFMYNELPAGVTRG